MRNVVLTSVREAMRWDEQPSSPVISNVHTLLQQREALLTQKDLLQHVSE